MNSEQRKTIIDRIGRGIQTDEDLDVLYQLLDDGDPGIKAQFAKYNITIGDAKGIHIGDRNYQSLDAEAIQAITDAIRAVLQEIKTQAPPTRRLTIKERKNLEKRKHLLEIVNDYWVDNFSDHDAPLKLRLKERLDLVKLPWTRSKMRQDLPPDTRIIDKFNSMETAGRLLILGGAGAGKSTALRELAKHLIDQAKENDEFPIPVAFYLPTWKDKKQSLEKWLISEFSSKYHLHESIIDPWLKKQQLLLLLDGLDEVSIDKRVACVEAINAFINKYGQTRIVIFSRFEEYKQLPPLECHSAIFIKRLKEKQVYDHLQKLQNSGLKLQGIRSALQKDHQLLELARTPLFLSIISKAYEDVDEVEKLTLGQNHEEHVQYLFERYVDRMTEPPKDKIRHPMSSEYSEENENNPDPLRNRCNHKQNKLNPTYSKKETIIWLQFLARNTSSNLFMIEEINRNWLPENLLLQYCLGVGLVAGLIMWFYGLVLGLTCGSLSFQMLAGLFTGLALGIIDSFINPEVRLLNSFGFSSFDWKAVHKSATPALLSVFIIPFFFASISITFDNKDLIWFLIFIGILQGLFTVIISGFVGGFTQAEFTIQEIKNTKPNQRIWQSAVKFLVTTIIAFPLVIILFYRTPFALPLSSLIGCISFYVGGLTCLQHMTIRMILCITKKIHRNYISFLDYATTQLLMDRVGGSYSFKHDLLRKYLSKQEIQVESKRISSHQNSFNIIIVIVLIFVIISILFSAKYDSFKVSYQQEIFFNSNIKEGQILIKENKLLNKSLELKLGDIIFFKLPNTSETTYGKIIGCPDNTISVMNGEIIVNWIRKNEYFKISPDIQIKDAPKKLPTDIYKIISIKENEENRNNYTVDISTNDIKQKVIKMIWQAAL